MAHVLVRGFTTTRQPKSTYFGIGFKKKNIFNFVDGNNIFLYKLGRPWRGHIKNHRVFFQYLIELLTPANGRVVVLTMSEF